MKKMKIRNLLPLISLLVVITANAQGSIKEKKEHVKSLKIAYITNELKLTPEEAAKFWPIYNSFDEKFFELRHTKMRRLLTPKNEDKIDELSENEASQLLTQMENNEEEMHQIRKKYIASLRGILPSYKIIKLKKAEDDFNKKLLQQYRELRPRN